MKKCNNTPHCAVDSLPGKRKPNHVHRQSRWGRAFKLVTLHASIFEAILMIMSRCAHQSEGAVSKQIGEGVWINSINGNVRAGVRRLEEWLCRNVKRSKRAVQN